MDKIAIFYHIYQVNHWGALFEKQIISMQQSDVYGAASYIHFGINGSERLPYDLIKVNVTKRNNKIDSEADTLANLHTFCVKNPDYKVLYLHTKGVSYPENHPGQTAWLNYLDYFNVKRWKECVALLNYFDCVGTDWTTRHPNQPVDVPPHYSGNFWWANASYISKLDVNYLYNLDSDSDNLTKINAELRHSPEFWIGTGNPKYYNYYSTNKNKYVEVLHPKEYLDLDIDYLKEEEKPKNLKFEYRIIYAKFWEMLSTALNDAYGHKEKPGTLVSLGTYAFSDAQEIKKRTGSSKIIVYQSEPLVENHWWNSNDLIEKIRNSDEIWDYDLQNIKVLKDNGIDAKFRPPVFSKTLQTVKNVENPDIDVLFYGVLTPYRSKILYDFVEGVNVPQNLTNIYLNVNYVFLWNMHGSQLDEFIGRSKIILNLNPYEGECRQQQTRIFYTLINNKCVLSEKNKINYYGDMITEFSGVQDMFNKIIDLLENDKWKTYTNNNFEQYSKKLVHEGEQMFAHLLNESN